jgi:uncharacterized membrane protein YphA (DoxX/SURF4 family)
MALGLVGLAFADFALQWQPVPKGIQAHTLLAYLSGAILAVAGLALFTKRWAAAGALVLSVFYGFWVVALHGPVAAARPTFFAVWQGVAEILALSIGGMIAWASVAAITADRKTQVVRVARIVFALCLLVFGASHFLYARFTAAMTPAWIPPGPIFWTYATGAAHIAAGLALLSGLRAKLAARLLTPMFGLFAALVHLPAVAADPGTHVNWLGLTITLALTGAAWVVADSL